jgi:hypothetical protein
MTGLVSLQHKTLLEMNTQGLLPYSHGYSASLLAQDAKPYKAGLARRLKRAPAGGVLAVDLLVVKQEGTLVQGVGEVYSSSDNGVVWGHNFVSSALVFAHQDAYPLQLAPFLSKSMATKTYPEFNATEGTLNIAGDVHEVGYEVKAVVFDAQFSTRLGLRSLKFLPMPFVGRCRTDLWLRLDKERVQVRTLAERYPPGKARYYKRFKYYAKRLAVELDEVGHVDLVLVWKAKGEDWACFALLSTLKAGIQDVLEVWSLRWDLEASHRLYKQNLGLGKCQCRRYPAQLKHADLVLDAFLELREERQRHPDLCWRKAQEQLSDRRRNAMLTDVSPMAV